MDPVRFVLDGEEVAVARDPRSATLDALREECGALACKQGCAPQALCGCCAVLVDGRPRLACTLPLRGVAGRSVQTARTAPNADVIARALAACGASACGYCTPGMLVSAAALLAGDRSPDDAAVQRAFALHLCRCTGYGPVLDGVRLAAGALRGEVELPCVSDEALALARGERPFAGDLSRTGMLHGAVVLAPGSGAVDAVEAPGADGLVVVVLRAVGAAVAEGEPVLALAHADPVVLRGCVPTARVVVVPAADPVDPVVFRGARADAPDDAFGDRIDACERIVEHSIAFDATDAAPLEPESAFAIPATDTEPLHVYSPGEDAVGEAVAIAGALGVPVRVTRVPSGGSYGARRAPGVQEAAAALALASARPVRVVVSHEDGVRLRAKRPAVRVRARLGLDGTRPIALDVALEVDGGARCLWAEQLLDDAWAALPPVLARRLTLRVVRSAGGRTAPMRGAVSVPVGVAVALSFVEAGVDARTLCAGALVAALDAVPPSGGATRVAYAWAPGSARSADSGRVRVDAQGERLCVRADVPELGEGHRDALRLGAAEGLGVDPARVDVEDDDAFGAPGQAPERAWRGVPSGDALHAAARAAAGGLSADGNLLGATADGPGALARVELGDDGRLLAIRLAGGSGRTVMAGAAAMGVGRVLVEELPRRPDGAIDPRLRGLGVPKLRHAPPVEAVALRDAPWGDADAAHVAAAAATAAALMLHEGGARACFPARGNNAAAQLGARSRAVTAPARSGGEADRERDEQHGEPHAAGTVS